MNSARRIPYRTVLVDLDELARYSRDNGIRNDPEARIRFVTEIPRRQHPPAEERQPRDGAAVQHRAYKQSAVAPFITFDVHMQTTAEVGARRVSSRE